MTDAGPPPSAPLPSAPQPPRRRGRWLLIASLALNFVLIGAMVGGAARMLRTPPQSGVQPGSALVLLWRALPDDQQRALRAEQGRGEQGRSTEDRRAARAGWRDGMVAEVAALRALLTAEPFDRAALEARLAAARDAQAARAAATLGRMLDRIEAMSPEERAAMVERLERRTRRPGDRFARSRDD